MRQLGGRGKFEDHPTAKDYLHESCLDVPFPYAVDGLTGNSGNNRENRPLLIVVKYWATVDSVQPIIDSTFHQANGEQVYALLLSPTCLSYQTE